MLSALEILTSARSTLLWHRVHCAATRIISTEETELASKWVRRSSWLELAPLAVNRALTLASPSGPALLQRSPPSHLVSSCCSWSTCEIYEDSYKSCLMPLAKVDLGFAVFDYLDCDPTLLTQRYDGPEVDITCRPLLQALPPLGYCKSVLVVTLIWNADRPVDVPVSLCTTKVLTDIGFLSDKSQPLLLQLMDLFYSRRCGR